jgi:tetratricopeptide (TPR) repeat protein
MRAHAERLSAALEAVTDVDPLAWTALSRVYEWLGDADSEARALERRVEALLHSTVTENDVESLYRLAEIRLRDANRRSDGVLLLRRALEARPDFERAEPLLLRAAQVQGDRKETIDLLEEVARLSGHEETLVTALSLGAITGTSNASKVREGVELGRSLGRVDDVIALLRGALDHGDDAYTAETSAWIREQLAELLLETEDFRTARDLLEQATDFTDQERARCLRLRAARLSVERLDDLDRAARLYAQVLDENPANRDAWAPLLDVFRRQGDQESLIALIHRTVPLVESMVDRGRLRLEEATVLLARPERREEAATLLKQIIKEHPTLHEATQVLGELLSDDGRFEELAELIERQLDVAKTNGEVDAVEALSLRLGSILEQGQHGSSALDVYEGVLGWAPRSRSALRAIARLTESLEKDRGALADVLERLLAVEETNAVAEVSRRLIDLRTELDDRAGAERALEVAVRADPADPALRTRLIELYAERGERKKIADTLKAALVSAPSDRSLLVSTVRAFEEIDAIDDAITVITEEIERTPGDAELLRERSRLFRAAGAYDDAIADMCRSLRMFSSVCEARMLLISRALSRSAPPGAFTPSS